MKILHCADIHLDPPFSGLTIPQAQARREMLRGTFSDMTDYIISQNIPLVLISGDLFDTPQPAADTVAFVCERFSAAADTVFVIAPGNHDYGQAPWTELSRLENVRVFSYTSAASLDLTLRGEPIHVWGWGFEEERLEHNPLQGFRVSDAAALNVLCAHCALGEKNSPYAPVTKEELEQSGLDYAALGHVHNADGMRRIGETYYAYAGCLEGRSFDEVGTKGVYLLDLHKQDGALSFSAKRIRFAKRHYECETVDITGAEKSTQVVQAIRDRIAAAEYDENTVLRVILTGEVSRDLVLSTPFLEQQDYGIVQLEAEVRTEVMQQPPHDDLEHDPTVRGAFYRQLKPLLDSEDAEERRTAELALEYGLKALAGEEISLS